MSIRNRNGWFHYRFKLDGKTYAASTDLAATERNKRKAQQIESQARQDLLEGRNPERRVTVRTFADAAAEYLNWAKAEYRAHPNSSKRINTSFTSLKEHFGTTAVSMITAGEIERYKTWRLSEHEVRDVTLRHDLHALSGFFRYAQKMNWTRENPLTEVDIPSDKDAVRMHILTPAEEKLYFELAAGISQDLYDMGRLMLNQGNRPDELLAIRKEDVDLERGKLYIRFGKSAAARRTLTLTAESKSILVRRMQSAGPWIFPSDRLPGERVPRLNNAHDAVLAAAEKKGKKLAFVIYDLRHTFATRAAQFGIDLATLAAILGHSGLRVVQRYVHPTDEHKAQAMAKFESLYKAPEVRVQ